MNLGQVKIAAGLDVEVINGILVHLYEASAIPPEINLGIESGGKTINLLHARLEQPRVSVKYDDGFPVWAYSCLARQANTTVNPPRWDAGLKSCRRW